MFIPNSMARGAPRLKTPVPAPTRLVTRVAEVVPLTEPGAPVKPPVRAFGGKSKFAMLNRLKKPALGENAIVWARASSLYVHCSFRSKSRRLPMLTWLGGANCRLQFGLLTL